VFVLTTVYCRQALTEVRLVFAGTDDVQCCTVCLLLPADKYAVDIGCLPVYHHLPATDTIIDILRRCVNKCLLSCALRQVTMLPCLPYFALCYGAMLRVHSLPGAQQRRRDGGSSLFAARSAC